MPKQFNSIDLYEDFETYNDKQWFSFIKGKIKETPFCKLDLTVVVKRGKVVNIKTRLEDNLNLDA